MNSKERLAEQLKAFQAVEYELKNNNEGMDVKTVDHYHKWITDIIKIVEHAIKKEDEFELIKEKLIAKEGDLVFPFVERTKVDD